MTTSTDTTGLRSARMFDPCEADEWLAYVRYGREMDYVDQDTLNRMELFAHHIAANSSDVYLSRETEAKIDAFMRVANAF